MKMSFKDKTEINEYLQRHCVPLFFIGFLNISFFFSLDNQCFCLAYSYKFVIMLNLKFSAREVFTDPLLRTHESQVDGLLLRNDNHLVAGPS